MRSKVVASYFARRMEQFTAPVIRPYPRDRASVKRKHPCVVCAEPESAVRAGTRCRGCSEADQRTRSRIRTRPAPKVQQIPRYDSDVELYRAEKQARAEQTARELAAIKTYYESELCMAQPRRGRPRKYVEIAA